MPGSTGWPEARITHNDRKIELTKAQRHLLEKATKSLPTHYAWPLTSGCSGSIGHITAGLRRRGWIVERTPGFFKITFTGELALKGDIGPYGRATV